VGRVSRIGMQLCFRKGCSTQRNRHNDRQQQAQNSLSHSAFSFYIVYIATFKRNYIVQLIPLPCQDKQASPLKKQAPNLTFTVPVNSTSLYAKSARPKPYALDCPWFLYSAKPILHLGQADADPLVVVEIDGSEILISRTYKKEAAQAFDQLASGAAQG